MKNIDFFTTGSLTSTLLFTNQVVPDVYVFPAQAGERIRLETSNTDFDTTIRVVGPDAAINLFDDDSGEGTASRLVFTAADTGWYVAVVSSFGGNPASLDNNNYVLNFARGDAALQAVSEVGEDPERGKSRPELQNDVDVKE
jgi:hypothetical protein